MLFIGWVQEKKTIAIRSEKCRAADCRSYPWIVRTTSVVDQFYVHCVDEDFGRFFPQVLLGISPMGPSCWSTGITMPRPGPPGPGSASPRWIAGLCAACDDVAGLQAVCDSLTEDKIEALARKWLAILAEPVLARGPGRRVPVRHLRAAGGVLPHPGAGQAGLRGGDPRCSESMQQPRHRPPGDEVRPGLRTRRMIRKGPHVTPGRFGTRVISQNVHPEPARRWTRTRKESSTNKWARRSKR